jgi:(R,R)-butanediol dehydrogenase / meso-butanediol dehydrogenase / diacetyl reductase
LHGEKTYIGSSCYTPEEYREVIEAVGSGKIKPLDMVTARIPLEKTHDDGILELINHKDKHIKILVSPTLA